MRKHNMEVNDASIPWLIQAADGGSVEATYLIGMHACWNGHVKNGVAWLFKAAQTGYTYAKFALARIYYMNGDRINTELWLMQVPAYVQHDIAQNLHYYISGANAGHDIYMYLLSFYYESSGDSVLGKEWWMKAVIYSERYATKIFEGGWGVDVEVSKLKWYSAAKAGNVQAMLLLADHCRRKNDMMKAVEWWRRAADAGNAQAMIHLGEHYGSRGWWAISNQWYERAVSETGDLQAMYRLGSNLQLQKEDERALQWFKRGALSGAVDSMMALANLYRDMGYREAAIEWYEAAGMRQNGAPMFALWEMYEEVGDQVTAEKWRQKAEEAGVSIEWRIKRHLERRR